VTLAVVGVLLLVAAAVVRWVVLPSVSQLPEDFSSTQEYAGTYSGINQEALVAGEGQIVVQDVPVTASRTYATESTEGDVALVTRTLERSIGGQAEPATELRYAVDRGTFESTDPPAGTEDVVASEGLIFTLPIGPETDADYRLWDQTTEAAYPLTYEGESTLEGRTVYEFRSVAEGEIADPAALGLPTEIPRPLLSALGPVLADILPPELLAQLPAILAQLPDVVPVTYTSVTTSTIFADADLGAPISTGSTQEITAELPLGPQTLEVPFSTVELTATDDSVAARADDTAGKVNSLQLVGTTLPLAFTVGGLLLIAIALVLAFRAGPRSGGQAPTERPATPVPA
jgi:hypothetical protein